MEWKIIKDYPKYSISSTGLIKNNKTNRILKHYLNSYGYYCVGLWVDKTTQRKPYIHRLLAEMFIPVDDKFLTQVDHIDRNPLNNNLNNLRWVTPKENVDNRGEFNKTGLYYDETDNIWCVQIKEKNTLNKVGCYSTLKKAIEIIKKKV